MRLAVYCITRDRFQYTKKSLKMLRTWAGMDFDLYVYDQASEDEELRDWLRKQKTLGHIKYLVLSEENVGQNLAANHLIDEMMKGEYDWILRWDNDAIPRTRRFLRKLVRRTQRFLQNEVICVSSPTITKLKHEPPSKGIGEELGFQYSVVDILGGICRLHPAFLFHSWRTLEQPFRFSEYAPLGFGEAMEMAKFCTECSVQLIRMHDLEVEHAGGEDAQKEEMPEEFTWERREVGRYVSYGL